MFHFLEHAAVSLLHARIVQNEVDQGASPQAALQTANTATAGGWQGAVNWIISNGPQLYSFAVMVAGWFGVKLPPVPPLPPVPNLAQTAPTS